MVNCTSFPVRQNNNIIFYVTHVILVPIVFGVGLMGNVMTSLLCNHASLRKETAVFIHICGLAIVDAISLLCTVPKTLQEAEIFPANITYSRFMAYADMGSYVFGNITHHAALWLLVTAGFLKLHVAKHPYGESRISRNGTNRIIVFVCVLVCVLFNFPRFLEVSVREVKGHCFMEMSLWTFEITSFGNLNLIKKVYPWAIISVCYALPLLLILIAILSLGRQAGWRTLRTTRLALNASNDDEKRRLGLLKAVWVLLISSLCLEIPNLAVEVFKFGFPDDIKMKATILYSSEIIAQYLGLIRASITFLILVVYCYDFRKALRRTLCCLCSCSDEFYEPCACCSPTYRRELKEAKEAEKEKIRQKEKRKAKERKAKEAAAAASKTNGRRYTRTDPYNVYPPSQATLYGPERIDYPAYDVYGNGTLLSVPRFPSQHGSEVAHSMNSSVRNGGRLSESTLGRNGSYTSSRVTSEITMNGQHSPQSEEMAPQNAVGTPEDIEPNTDPTSGNHVYEDPQQPPTSQESSVQARSADYSDQESLTRSPRDSTDHRAPYQQKVHANKNTSPWV